MQYQVVDTVIVLFVRTFHNLATSDSVKHQLSVQLEVN